MGFGSRSTRSRGRSLIDPLPIGLVVDTCRADVGDLRWAIVRVVTGPLGDTVEESHQPSPHESVSVVSTGGVVSDADQNPIDLGDFFERSSICPIDLERNATSFGNLREFTTRSSGPIDGPQRVAHQGGNFAAQIAKTED